jgi:hypothetical protein
LLREDDPGERGPQRSLSVSTSLAHHMTRSHVCTRFAIHIFPPKSGDAASPTSFVHRSGGGIRYSKKSSSSSARQRALSCALHRPDMVPALPASATPPAIIRFAQEAERGFPYSPAFPRGSGGGFSAGHVSNASPSSPNRADQLDTEGDPEGAATWRWIARAIEQLANTKLPGAWGKSDKPIMENRRNRRIPFCSPCASGEQAPLLSPKGRPNARFLHIYP